MQAFRSSGAGRSTCPAAAVRKSCGGRRIAGGVRGCAGCALPFRGRGHRAERPAAAL